MRYAQAQDYYYIILNAEVSFWEVTLWHVGKVGIISALFPKKFCSWIIVSLVTFDYELYFFVD